MRKFKSVFAILYVVIGLALNVEAQTPNTNDPLALGKNPCDSCPGQAKAVDKTVWNSRIASGFSLTDGNSETTLLHIDAKTEKEKDQGIWFFGVQEKYGENDDETNVDMTSGKGSYKHLLSDLFYVGFATDYLRDEISDIKYRVIPSLMPGYFLIKETEIEFNLEAGPAYVFEEVGGISNDYFAPKIGNGFKYQISPTSKIFQTSSVLFDINDSDNYIADVSAGLEAAINSSLSLILSVRDIYDNVPAEGKKQNDIAFITSIGVNF